MKKDSLYFSHDYNARGDQKIIKLRISAGWEGYGIYWAVIEKMYEEGGPLDADFEALAFDLKAKTEAIKTVCKSPGLFYEKDGKIGSLSVERRLAHRQEISGVRASAGSLGGKARVANAKQMLSNCVAKSSIERKKERKKERRAKSPGGDASWQQIFSVWRTLPQPFPQPQSTNGGRESSAKARWKEHPDPGFWKEVIERIKISSFCRGENDRNWIANIDFLLRPSKADMVLEGKYDDRIKHEPASYLEDNG